MKNGKIVVWEEIRGRRKRELRREEKEGSGEGVLRGGMERKGWIGEENGGKRRRKS